MHSLPVVADQPIRSDYLADLLPPVAPESVEPLPMSRAEMRRRGWDEVDVVFVTGDAYVDHPSLRWRSWAGCSKRRAFASRILSQPDWQSCEPWRQFGRPRLFFAISAGNMDSMINHYTANRKVRNDDAYSPGGQIGLRPDRATLAYCQRAREAYHGRAGHRRRRRGQPAAAGALRLLERQGPPLDPARLQGRPARLRHGRARASSRSPSGWRPARRVRDLRDMRGVAYRLGAERSAADRRTRSIAAQLRSKCRPTSCAFAEMTQDLAQRNQSATTPRRLVQYHDREAVVVNPPALAAGAGGDGPRLRPAVHAQAAPELRQASRFPRTR